MGELTPVVEMDGRKIVNRSGKNVLKRIQEKFLSVIPRYAETLTH
jgi:branched-chain amino acid aminotransferase